MYYCAPCGRARGWPTESVTSQGICEVCRQFRFVIDENVQSFTNTISLQRKGNTLVAAETTCVNIKHAPFDVYIGRAGKGQDGYFGNPFKLDHDNPAQRAAVLRDYQAYFEKRIREDRMFKLRVLALKGKRLGCFCKPKACHGDVIVAYLEKQ